MKKKKHTDIQLSMNVKLRLQRMPSPKLDTLITVICTGISVALWLLG